ncbi:MAG: hypothetical protein V2A79_17835 [Planctomycetota bacterium]
MRWTQEAFRRQHAEENHPVQVSDKTAPAFRGMVNFPDEVGWNLHNRMPS